MITEKNITQTWKKRFGYPISGYERQSQAFAREVKKLTPSTDAKIAKVTQNAQTIILGTDALDLDQTQRMIKLLDDRKRRERILITPRFHPKDQHLINRYLDKKLPLEDVTQKISKNWLEKKNFDLLLPFIQKHNIRVRAIGHDILKEENERIENQIGNKDKSFDQKIIWLGPLRLSSKNIRVRAKNASCVLLYFQYDNLRWKFSKHINWQTVDQNEFVDLRPSPLIALDNYNNSLEYEDDLISISELKKTVARLSKYFTNVFSQKKTPLIRNILHPFDRRSIDAINRLKNSKPLYSFLRSRIFVGESATIPQKKAILISNRKISHVAEEVAHYLRTSHRPNQRYGRAATIVEEALAFFASLLINPKRKIPSTSKKINSWDEVHLLGYEIGYQLFIKWNQTEKKRKDIKLIWNSYPKDEPESKVMLDTMLKI